MQWCWFHQFDHPFDGESDGWACHAYEPKLDASGNLVVAPKVRAKQ